MTTDSTTTLPVAGTKHVSTVRTDQNSISEKELNECDRLKLHLLGSIQGGAGHIIFISYPQAQIIAADAKIRTVPWIRERGSAVTPHARRGSFGSDGAAGSITNSLNSCLDADDDELAQKSGDLLGCFLQSWVPYKLYHEIIDAIEGMKKAKSQRTFHFLNQKDANYAITLSTTMRDFSVVAVEIEHVDSREASTDFYSTLVSLGRIMEFYADEKIVKTACDTIFKLLGQFDRGMVYQFNDDLSGEVIHEIKKESVTSSYLGMRFPAGDIPLSARQLYIKNGLRYVQDANAEDVRIIRLGDGEMDLSHCRMRACAKPHLIYMRNMGVICSMSIAIVVENELWGLLAFHGYQKPFKPSLQQRIACESINSMVSVKVEALLKKAQSVRIIELSEMLMRWDQNNDVAKNLETIGTDILQIVDADVLVARIQDPTKQDKDSTIVGDKVLVPGEAFWSKFRTYPTRELCSVNTRKAIEQMGLSKEACPASGIVYFRDGLVQIMLGRGLRSKDVRWGGNPDEPKLRIGGVLNPRNSFDTFMEKAKKESRAWTTKDLHVVTALMDRVCEHSHNRMMTLLKSDIEEANVKYFNAISRARENSSFFAQMSHEIRTPFHGVMGCLNMLDESRDEMSPSEVKDMITTALSSGNHMLHLLDNIINISKNKYLSHSIAREKFNYHVLASEATQSLKSLAVSKHIDFSSRILPQHDYIVILTDKTKVVQIVSNIINNAIKFSPEGSIDVQFRLSETRKDVIKKWSDVASTYAGTVYTMNENEIFSSVDSVVSQVENLPELENQKWMLVSVTDSGCGMKPDELASMLEPYTQSNNGSNRAFQGTGLGLYICVSLCHQLGGFLACSSTPGAGTVFHVAVPVGIPTAVVQAPDKPKAKKHASLPLPAERIPLKGPIVICDDNKINLKILDRALKAELKKHKLHTEIMMADGGNAVVEIYKERRPSILFIDYHMPEVDGVEATEMIRKFEAENGIDPSYIISYTADVTEKAAQLLLARGTNEIMSKPPPKGFLSDIVGRFQPVNGQQ